MRKVILMILAVLLTCNINAQVKGFFEPVDLVFEKQSLARNVTDNKPIWLFRPYISMTGYAIQLGGGEPQSQMFNSVGFGGSWGKFKEVNEKAYCVFSLNGFLLTQVEIGEVTETSFGGAITGGVFNNFISLGVGYLGNHVMILTTISYSF